MPAVPLLARDGNGGSDDGRGDARGTLAKNIRRRGKRSVIAKIDLGAGNKAAHLEANVASTSVAVEVLEDVEVRVLCASVFCNLKMGCLRRAQTHNCTWNSSSSSGLMLVGLSFS